MVFRMARHWVTIIISDDGHGDHISMSSFLKRLFARGVKAAPRSYSPEAKFVVTVTESEIINQRPNGRVERALLADLKCVAIQTNDSGPLGSDIWWILAGSQGNGCMIPSGCTGEDKLLAALQRLPGFDNEEFIRAMASVSNQTFVCWKAHSE